MSPTRLACLAAVLLAGCTESPIEPSLDTGGVLQVRPRMARTVTGATVRLSAVAFDSAGTPVFTGRLRWSVLDPQLLVVDDSGAVLALAPGWGRVVAHSIDTALEDTAVIAVGLHFARIRAGHDYGCGWMEDGTSYCWGSGDRGNLGTGSPPAGLTPATPTPVTGGLHFTSIETGDQHTCAIAGSDVYCWGNKRQGALGYTACPAASEVYGGCHAPGRVDLAGTWTRVAVGTSDNVAGSCASGPDGLACWGEARLAAPEWSGCAYCSPELVSTELVGAVALGSQHGCALDADGRAFCWGDDRAGQLGAPIPPDRCRTSSCEASNGFIAVGTSEGFVDLVAGSWFACGLTAAGQAVCWGSYRRFFDPYDEPGPPPAVVAGELRFRKLDAGAGHVCGLTMEGAIWCWGDAAYYGALGEPLLQYRELVLEPRHVMPSMTFTNVAAGEAVTCGITKEGSTVCIGSFSGLGQGTCTIKSTSPLPLAPPGPLPGFIHFEQ